ncbi:Carnitine O-acetyltransferase [Hondaea fermentalgiana]|uniref:Carnitine O-acetyltransferase n=1 Tax=Hondaea fermentalgiana TaxID=2315210 RepID=A0A2R5GPY4_9STRA|nr:Carnitine O-acetyltransferase [Hondaea fermentalgiana]|eukprot:GBG31838.1 Carnitine O-acetyltransferase [Hondaea fermentalgiana]
MLARKLAQTRMRGAASSLRAMTTYSQQGGLPALPLGKLDETLDKFMATAEPFLQTKKEREEVQALVDAAKSDESMLAAQRKLEDIAEQDRNWLDRFWTSNAYMKWDVALPINSNVTGYLFGDARKQWDQAFSAAAITRGALLNHVALLEGSYPAKTARGDKVQCMDQYTRMFSLTRIPGIEEDHQVKYSEEESQHVVVIAGRRLYTVPVLQGREVVALDDLCATFATIKADATSRGPDPQPVSVLTALPRKDWARVRNRMTSDEVNASALHVVESAVFAISLEDGIDETDSDCAKTTFVGDGRTTWFDKSFQLKVKEDGNPSINVEHSWADAPVPLGMFFNDALPYAEAEAESGVDHSQGNALSFNHVEFHVDDALAADICKAERLVDIAIADSDVHVYQCRGLGRGRFPGSL